MAQFWLADSTTVTQPGYESALAAAEKAVALAPGLAAGYSARGFVRAVYRFDFAGAQADLDKAVALNPSDAVFCTDLPSCSPCLASCPRPLPERSRLSRSIRCRQRSACALAFFLVANQQLAQARPLYAKALAIAPNSVRANFNLGELELLENQPEQALAIFRQTEPEIFSLAGQAEAEYSLGHVDVSRANSRAVDHQARKDRPYFIARVYAWRGEKDQAFEWLERAYVQRDPGLTWVEIDPRSRSLRGDARFSALLRKMNYRSSGGNSHRYLAAWAPRWASAPPRRHRATR